MPSPPAVDTTPARSRRTLPGAGVAGLALFLLAACGDSPAAAPLPDDPIAISSPFLNLPVEVTPLAFEQIPVTLVRGDRTFTLTLEVADTFDRRTRGLMYRTGMVPDSGMLFAFPAATTTPFWNKDTPLDLDLLLLDADGVILAVHRLHALDPALVQPEVLYLYAVELPAGWLQTHDVGVSDRFLIPAEIQGRPE